MLQFKPKLICADIGFPESPVTSDPYTTAQPNVNVRSTYYLLTYALAQNQLIQY